MPFVSEVGLELGTALRPDGLAARDCEGSGRVPETHCSHPRSS